MKLYNFIIHQINDYLNNVYLSTKHIHTKDDKYSNYMKNITNGTDNMIIPKNLLTNIVKRNSVRTYISSIYNLITSMGKRE